MIWHNFFFKNSRVVRAWKNDILMKLFLSRLNFHEVSGWNLLFQNIELIWKIEFLPLLRKRHGIDLAAYAHLVGGLNQIKECLWFPNLDLPAIIILYEWSGISDQCGLCSCVFTPVTSSKLIITFTLLFFGVSLILLCRLFQNIWTENLCRMCMESFHLAFVFSYHH